MWKEAFLFVLLMGLCMWMMLMLFDWGSEEVRIGGGKVLLVLGAGDGADLVVLLIAVGSGFGEFGGTWWRCGGGVCHCVGRVRVGGVLVHVCGAMWILFFLASYCCCCCC